MLNVVLLSHTKDPEKIIARAGRLCYFKSNISDLEREMTEKKVKELIAKLSKSGHLSAFEHANFTFGVEGISRACSHQLVRHRIASYSQQSQRYVIFKENFNYITPKSISNKKSAKKIFDDFIKFSKETYDRLIELGIDREDARYVLPNSAETKIIVSMNARELLHFFTLRLCKRAQWEIREMAKLMLKRVKDVCPNIFVNAGPECIRTKCPEGEMSCGMSKEVKKELKNL
ncbi:MAG: FAD-dependent thymidylate synthase [Proteobacteria bacterium]|nr:FAD-dependent thymidylate synthase [Pseudomonadota bacterium]